MFELNNMWINISKLPGYLLKIHKTRDTVSIYVTNYEEIWRETMSCKALEERCKKQQMEGSADDLCKKILEMAKETSKPSDGRKDDEPNGQDRWLLVLRQPIPDSAAHIVCRFSMEKLSVQEFYKHIMVPNLTYIRQLCSIKTELLEIIRKKDEEIAEYKACGSTNPARKHVITKPFKLDDFNELHSMKTLPCGAFDNLQAVYLHSGSDLADLFTRMEQLKIVTKPQILPETIESGSSGVKLESSEAQKTDAAEEQKTADKVETKKAEKKKEKVPRPRLVFPKRPRRI